MDKVAVTILIEVAVEVIAAVVKVRVEVTDTFIESANAMYLQQARKTYCRSWEVQKVQRKG